MHDSRSANCPIDGLLTVWFSVCELYHTYVEYLRRIIDDELDDLFPQVPAIAIDGPKAVGKTTTAEQRVDGLLRLDSRANRTAVEADPELVRARARPLLIDEWQKVPEVWDVVRRVADENPTGGQFLLVGSARSAPGATAHSGAGRIGRLRMRPMTLSERGVSEPAVSLRVLLAGRRPPSAASATCGWPTTPRRSSPPASRAAGAESAGAEVPARLLPAQRRRPRRPRAGPGRAQAGGYARLAPGLCRGHRLHRQLLRLLDAATPGQADKPARSTSIAYRDVLTQLWLLDPVPAWAPTGHPLTRLGQAPKHHLADPALAARLLGPNLTALLDGDGQPLGPQAGTMLGHLFESLVTLCVRVPAQAADATVGHLRTRNGDHEIDLVLIRDDGRVLAIEVKLNATVDDRDTAHLHWLAGQLGDTLLDAVVINTGPHAYRRPDGIAVVPLGLLGP